MSSTSEYDKLKTIILGSVDDYKAACWGWKSEIPDKEAKFSKAIQICNSAIPNSVLDEVSEDLASYEKTLKNFGVSVIRPPRFLAEPIYETDNFYSYGQDFYNMRDLHIVFGGLILASSPAQPNRIFEIENLRAFFESIAEEFNMTLIQSTPPKLRTNAQRAFFRDQIGNLVLNEKTHGDELEAKSSEIWHRLDEDEILFDAANIVRFGADALYLISSTGNACAARWLSSKLVNLKFHVTDVYRSSHLDSTILPLSPDTFLVNSARVNEENLPGILKNKNVLYFDDVAEIPIAERDFHNQYRLPAAARLRDLGFNTNLSEMSSPWAGLNVLSYDEQTVLVEENQIGLVKFLESHGYEVIRVRLRHPFTFLGGLHCTTLDISRDYP